MATAIGLRFYKIEVLGPNKRLRVNDPTTKFDCYEFFKDTIELFDTVSDDENDQKGWYFTPVPTASIRNMHGVIRYGTYGFESDLIDRKTRKRNYKRKANDLEEIPLYYQFWFPSGHDFGLAAFQSFKGRSCVTMVTTEFKERFHARFPGSRMSFRKLMPEDVAGSVLASAPVKQVTLIKKSVPYDRADAYISDSVDEYDYEVTFRAKRRKSLGDLLSLRNKVKNSDQGAALTYGGEDFDEMKAEIIFGKRRRVVGVFGLDRDAGVIEIGDTVKRDPSGHPDLMSIEAEVDQLMQDFYQVMVEKN